MSVTSNVVAHVDSSRRRRTIVSTLTLAGNYTTGGETIDLTLLTNPKLLSLAYPGSVPSIVFPQNTPGGYAARWVPGTTLKNGKLKFYSAPGVELAAGAYPAALIADTISLEMSGRTGGF